MKKQYRLVISFKADNDEQAAAEAESLYEAASNVSSFENEALLERAVTSYEVVPF